MTCSNFIRGFSEFYDGVAPASFKEHAESHLASCPDCRRYLEVVDRGRDLLRSLKGVDLTEDFGPRLQHRIYHVADAEALSGNSASGATAATAFGMAILLVFAAWSPALLSTGPEVQLAPIVVSRPGPRPVGLRSSSFSLFPKRRPLPFAEAGLWSQPADLLFQHSSLNEGRGTAEMRRADFD